MLLASYIFNKVKASDRVPCQHEKLLSARTGVFVGRFSRQQTCLWAESALNNTCFKVKCFLPKKKKMLRLRKLLHVNLSRDTLGRRAMLRVIPDQTTLAPLVKGHYIREVA